MGGKAGGAGPFELFGWSGPCLRNLLQGGCQFSLSQVKLIGRGSEVGGKHAGAKSMKLATGDIVGETKFFPECG